MFICRLPPGQLLYSFPCMHDPAAGRIWVSQRHILCSSQTTRKDVQFSTSRGDANERSALKPASRIPRSRKGAFDTTRKTNEAGKSRSTSATSHQSKYGNTSIDIDVRIKVTGHRVTATNLICGFTYIHVRDDKDREFLPS
ncbi:hypothetical protein CIHG_02297 [Coccidioides immitis H538.4]|uniref:Uncharacterized protein n=3 Tax=Coccidioides immitis TaxID=5501 RepID=A0A0J8QXT7_COCIT|nr:hypothetical protein CIRG_00466 [Coccidioides immitis RMSCC 2394]KMU76860.1 hypothetical protein CISG_05693 [Coccidioides immitis RMSCC 3703]KMU84513.1 hypothetical protein CIHG_02297 [Coccidioides immitis H538.4]